MTEDGRPFLFVSLFFCCPSSFSMIIFPPFPAAPLLHKGWHGRQLTSSADSKADSPPAAQTGFTWSPRTNSRRHLEAIAARTMREHGPQESVCRVRTGGGAVSQHPPACTARSARKRPMALVAATARSAAIDAESAIGLAAVSGPAVVAVPATSPQIRPSPAACTRGERPRAVSNTSSTRSTPARARFRGRGPTGDGVHLLGGNLVCRPPGSTLAAPPARRSRPPRFPSHRLTPGTRSWKPRLWRRSRKQPAG